VRQYENVKGRIGIAVFCKGAYSGNIGKTTKQKPGGTVGPLMEIRRSMLVKNMVLENINDSIMAENIYCIAYAGSGRRFGCAGGRLG
jgi:NDP-sugar pyrophosphorylase family protein